MGIKGIYREIGPGQRVSLCKLAIDQLEQSGRPLRLAIDFSIWQFQVQAARGGSNPAIRTLFYRLVRLLGLAIHPIFVFDGPNKPAFKRNKRSGRGDGVATAMAKHLIKLFGFTTHDAPGEAEAECALLEQQGVVDAVLSEDVDTIMFGCRRTLRNWTAEGTRGSKTPTHVSVYDAAAVGLDREGMVLVALMSGGDYLPEGVPGCGVKVACEAARAGFGRDLCRIKRADRDALAKWKARLLHELRTNESGFFRTRHRALEIPEDFPDMEVLRYYTHPVVSLQATVDRLKREFPPANNVDVVGLRGFARETFDWTFRVGAVKLIRVLGPSLLVRRLLDRYVSAAEVNYDDLQLVQKEEAALVKAISGRREHFSTDATPELRISFVPSTIVKLDLDAEPEEEVEEYGRTGIALNSDDEFDDEAGGEPAGEKSKAGGNSRKPFDPSQPELVWIPETIVKLGVPLAVEDWEAEQRAKKQRAASKATRKTKVKATDMPVGALDKYVKVTKSVDNISKDSAGSGPEPGLPPPSTNSQPHLPAPRGRTRQTKKSSTTTQVSKPTTVVNPWTMAAGLANHSVMKATSSFSPRGQSRSGCSSEPILIESSPVAAAAPPTPGPGLTHPTTPTKKKRPQTSPTVIGSSPPLFAVSPSPGKRRAPAREYEAKQAVSSPPPVKEPRGLKRVRNGAKSTGIVSSQKSITGYGRVLKDGSSSQTSVKPIPSPADPFIDENNPPRPTFKPPPDSPLSRGNSPLEVKSPVANDDPFGPRCTQSPLAPLLPTETVRPFQAGRSPESQQQPPNHPTKPDFTEPDSTEATTETANQQIPATTNPITNSIPSPSTTTADFAPANFTISSSSSTTTTTTTTTTKSKTTKLFIPRQSLTGLGYYTEIEVSREEADAMTAAAAQRAGDGNTGRRGAEGRRGQKPRAYRLSELEVVDLTGED